MPGMSSRMMRCPVVKKADGQLAAQVYVAKGKRDLIELSHRICLADGSLQVRVGRDRPPRGFPERLADDVGLRQSDEGQCRAVGFQ